MIKEDKARSVPVGQQGRDLNPGASRSVLDPKYKLTSFLPPSAPLGHEILFPNALLGVN